MKKIYFVPFFLLALMAGENLSAQSVKELAKERKELAKYSKSELNSKATKAARKEAKALKKAGWLVAPGALPMDKQLDRSYKMQYEYDENNYPSYIMGEAMSTGEKTTMQPRCRLSNWPNKTWPDRSRRKLQP